MNNSVLGAAALFAVHRSVGVVRECDHARSGSGGGHRFRLPPCQCHLYLSRSTIVLRHFPHRQVQICLAGVSGPAIFMGALRASIYDVPLIQNILGLFDTPPLSTKYI